MARGLPKIRRQSVGRNGGARWRGNIPTHVARCERSPKEVTRKNPVRKWSVILLDKAGASGMTRGRHKQDHVSKLLCECRGSPHAAGGGRGVGSFPCPLGHFVWRKGQ